MNKKTLVLFSGGADCVVVAKLLQQQGHDLTLLHFDYGQKGEEREFQAVHECARHMGLAYSLRQVNCFDGMRTKLLKGTPGEGKDLVGDVEYVPARNLIMLSIAAGYAESFGYNFLAIGNHASTRAYPDNTPEFASRFNAVLEYALFKGRSCTVLAPVNMLAKGLVMKLGLDIGAPLHLSWSCYVSDDKPCGKCIACQSRREAFESINQPDPAL